MDMINLNAMMMPTNMGSQEIANIAGLAQFGTGNMKNSEFLQMLKGLLNQGQSVQEDTNDGENIGLYDMLLNNNSTISPGYENVLNDIIKNTNPESAEPKKENKPTSDYLALISQLNAYMPMMNYDNVNLDQGGSEYLNIVNKVLENKNTAEMIAPNNAFSDKNLYDKGYANEAADLKAAEKASEPVLENYADARHKTESAYTFAQAEKLTNLINSHKEDLKNKIDINKASLGGKGMYAADDKIITVSDESNEIKAQVFEQVKDNITFLSENTAKGEEKRVVMELYPQKLGKVEIKMTYEKDKLVVEIGSNNKETQKLLASNAHELTKILSKSTEAEVSMNIKPYTDNFDQRITNYTDNQYEGHNRQKNHYFYEGNNDDKDDSDDSDFSELINLRNLKLNLAKGG